MSVQASPCDLPSHGSGGSASASAGSAVVANARKSAREARDFMEASSDEIHRTVKPRGSMATDGRCRGREHDAPSARQPDAGEGARGRVFVAMLILMKAGATPEQIDNVCKTIR